jgi:hypothetical protein
MNARPLPLSKKGTSMRGWTKSRMRPGRRWIVGVGALTVVGGLVLGITGGLALASDGASHSKAGCSLATLHGTYNFASDGVQIAPADGAGPFAYAGLVTYDGKGGVTQVITLSANGVITRHFKESGTYTVNSDCTDSEVDMGGGTTQHYDGFLRPDGNQFAFVQTDPGIVSAGTLTRITNHAKGN